MTTSPGFSSRSTPATYRQLPQRDEAIVSEFEPGFSNSAPNDGNAAVTIKAPVKAEVESKVVGDETVEDKAVAKKAPAKKKR